jgi:hypothetical protein
VTIFGLAVALNALLFFVAGPSEPGRAAEDAALVLFVDANQGNDGNGGLSPQAALRTLNAAQAAMDKVPEGDRLILMLARGSVWREAYEHRGPGRAPRYPDFTFGRPGLTIRAYGEGDKPTISGYDLLDNRKFARHDPHKYPHVWSQRVTPPATYYIRYWEKAGAHPGVLVGGDRGLVYVWTPLAENEQMRDQPLKQIGIENEADALNFVNTHAGSFYARHNKDRTADYFVNSGSDPTTDGLTYEYKVRGAFFITAGNTWENIRYKGLTHRDGVGGRVHRLKGVEFLYGTTHNMLLSEGHFEDVLSLGLRPAIEGVSLHGFGNTGTAFHTHGVAERGILYDRCTAKNVGIAFFDHRAGTNRPAAVLRDCLTEDVDTIMGHGECTLKAFIVGHRHQGHRGTAMGQLGGLTAGENFIEDSVFRLALRGGWHSGSKHLRVRNTAFYMPAGQPPMFLGRGVDFEYKHCTLILDFSGQDISNRTDRLAGWSSPQARASEDPRGTWKLKNSIIAAVNAPNMKTAPDMPGTVVRFGELPVDLTLENCLLTYLGDVPETAGKAGRDYHFAAPEDIFTGNPSQGDYRLKPGGIAEKMDVGYRPGRRPVYRPLADKTAAEFGY